MTKYLPFYKLLWAYIFTFSHKVKSIYKLKGNFFKRIKMKFTDFSFFQYSFLSFL